MRQDCMLHAACTALWRVDIASADAWGALGALRKLLGVQLPEVLLHGLGLLPLILYSGAPAGQAQLHTMHKCSSSLLQQQLMVPK